MMNREPVAGPVLVVGCDDRYAIALAVTLHSTLTRISSESPRLLVVDGGISADSRRRLERVISSASPGTRVDWHAADRDRFAGLKVSKWGSTANYLRLLIPELIGQEADRVIYLDSDLLVRADVSRLAELAESSSAPIQAVGDYHHRRCRTVFGEAGCLEAGIDADAPYFNSGVMTINVEVWREEDVPEQAVEFVRLHRDVMKHSDQDALNAVLAYRWESLDAGWNVMVPSLGRYLDQEYDDSAQRRRIGTELLDQGSILHFTGARKPWLPGYMGPKGLEYRRALRDSSWFDDRAESLRWSFRFWTRSPMGWAREIYRRLRKRAALTYRRIRPAPSPQG